MIYNQQVYHLKVDIPLSPIKEKACMSLNNKVNKLYHEVQLYISLSVQKKWPNQNHTSYYR